MASERPALSHWTPEFDRRTALPPHAMIMYTKPDRCLLAASRRAGGLCRQMLGRCNGTFDALRARAAAAGWCGSGTRHGSAAGSAGASQDDLPAGTRLLGGGDASPPRPRDGIAVTPITASLYIRNPAAPATDTAISGLRRGCDAAEYGEALEVRAVRRVQARDDPFLSLHGEPGSGSSRAWEGGHQQTCKSAGQQHSTNLREPDQPAAAVLCSRLKEVVDAQQIAGGLRRAGVAVSRSPDT